VLSKTIVAAVLITITAGIHVAGFARILRSLWPLTVKALDHELPTALLLMRMVWLLMLVHMVEVGVWGVALPPHTLLSGCRVCVLLCGCYLYISGLR